MTVWAAYYLGINLLTFCMFIIDKRKAVNGNRRIAEKTLLIASAIGGALGGWLAMQLFRHKTKHKLFTISLPLMMIIHGVLIYFLI